MKLFIWKIAMMFIVCSYRVSISILNLYIIFIFIFLFLIENFYLVFAETEEAEIITKEIEVIQEANNKIANEHTQNITSIIDIGIYTHTIFCMK